MNPNAFTFTPGASSFVPGKSWAPPAEAAPEEVSESWDDGEDDAPAAAPAATPAPAPAPVVVEAPEPAPAVVEAPEPAPVVVKKPEPEPEPVVEEVPTKDDIIDDLVAAEDGKKHVNLIFIGHVDAGKSTLCGQIMWLMGNIDDRTLQKYEDDAKAKNRESWKFAYAMDTNEEERDKGKTVEVGRAFFMTENKKFTVLDAPGHKNFVPHMIGGASQADIGVLVISTRKNEFEAGFEKMGQTREHITLAKTAGVKELIIVLNKMDDPSNGEAWSKARYDECKSKLSPFLKESGFRPRKDVKWIPISAILGINIKDGLPDDVCPWWSQDGDRKSLLQTLNDMPPPERLLHAPARMPIADKYTEMGLIVMGKLQSGVFSLKEKCVLCPVNTPCQIEKIIIHGKECKQALPGDNVKMYLKGVDEDLVRAGFILCPAKCPVKSATIFDAQVKILEHKSIICPGYTCVLHIHSVVEDVTITNLLYKCTNGKPDASKKNPKFIREGEMCIVRLRVPQSMCVETFKDFDQFGRFMLRDEGRTIGMGIVKVLRK